jgi:4'-phosphopantetheinyl transferase EntD
MAGNRACALRAVFFLPRMIHDVLPLFVSASEVVGRPPIAGLFPEEAQAVEGAGDVRQAEFAAGRECARRAMLQLGRQPSAITKGAGGAPSWPTGVIGSITHCREYVAAAVCDETLALSIGIDAEPNASVSGTVMRRIASDQELDMIRRLRASNPDVHWDRLLFSAKESVYKASHPVVIGLLRFRDVTVDFQVATRSFSASLLRSDVGPRVPRTLSGRWHCSTVLLTGVVIPNR